VVFDFYFRMCYSLNVILLSPFSEGGFYLELNFELPEDIFANRYCRGFWWSIFSFTRGRRSPLMRCKDAGRP